MGTTAAAPLRSAPPYLPAVSRRPPVLTAPHPAGLSRKEQLMSDQSKAEKNERWWQRARVVAMIADVAIRLSEFILGH